eukprot:473370_1
MQGAQNNMIFQEGDDPFYHTSYHNAFILYFDILCLSISSILCSIVLILWIRQLCYFSTNDPQSKVSEIKPNNSISSIDTESQSTSVQKQTQNTKKRSYVHIHSKILTTLVIVIATLFIWLLTLFSILVVYQVYPSCIVYGLCFQLIYIERLCLYLYYLSRAYHTFKDSFNAIDKHKIIIMISIMSSIWIFGQFFYSIYTLLGNCTELSIIIGIIPLGVAETVFSTFSIVLFFMKLKQIDNFCKSRNNKETAVSIKMGYLMTKLTILSLVSILTTFLVLSIYIFTFSLGLLAIDTPINIICLILSFSCNDKYYQPLCKSCISVTTYWRARKEPCDIKHLEATIQKQIDIASKSNVDAQIAVSKN